MARILIQISRDAFLTDFALEVTSGLLRTTKRLPYHEMTAVNIQETWRDAKLVVRGSGDASDFHITTSKETAAKARSIILERIQEWQRLAQQMAAYPALEPYRGFAFALLRCRYTQMAIGDNMLGTMDVFGILQSKRQEVTQDDNVPEPEAILSVKILLARIADYEPWSPEEITAHISNLKQLQAAEFSRKPWVVHKQEPYQLLPDALEALRTFERCIHGFSLDELSDEIRSNVLDSEDFRDIEVRTEALINKYTTYPRAVEAIRNGTAHDLSILEEVARTTLEDFDRTCPQCEERFKTEPSVCRNCGYRFEGVTANQELAEVRLKAERIAIAAAREVAGLEPKSSTAVEIVDAKAIKRVIEARRKAQDGTTVMADGWISPIKKLLRQMAETATDVAYDTAKRAQDSAKIASESYKQSGLKDTINSTASWTKEQLEKTGITETVVTVSDTVSEEFDKISGKKILDLVEERLALQERYNDILATKLEEALQRIAALEERVRTGERP
jgi:predicted Zn-ribbon and HTH transcriptional regulator